MKNQKEKASVEGQAKFWQHLPVGMAPLASQKEYSAGNLTSGLHVEIINEIAFGQFSKFIILIGGHDEQSCQHSIHQQLAFLTDSSFLPSSFSSLLEGGWKSKV